MFFNIQSLIWPVSGAPSSAHHNLMLIGLARLVMFLLAQLLILINTFWLNLEFSDLQAHIVLGIYAAVTLFGFYRVRLSKRVSQLEILFHLVLDVLIMTSLFYVSGGAANPFVSILLFPLIVSASILPKRFTWFMVLLTLVSYGCLFLFSTDSETIGVAHEMSGHQMSHGRQDSDSSIFSLHIVGMWFNFAISAILISFFVVRMSDQIRKQQEKINAHRETALRDEQLLGIATQAASAAHHMSTPLSTMAIIVDDLKRETRHQDIGEDLEVLGAQIDNCKQVLDKLRQHANHSTKAAIADEPVSVFIEQLLDEFRLLHPEAKLQEQIAAGLDKVDLSSDPSLRMALLNVLNNAVDASPDKLCLSVNVESNQLHIHVKDDGQGLPESLKDRLYEGSMIGPVASSKPEGMGLGLFLSHATINLHQGRISLESDGEKGTMTHIELPLKRGSK